MGYYAVVWLCTVSLVCIGSLAYIHAHTHINSRKHTYTNTRKLMRACMHVRTNTCKHTHARAHVRTRPHAQNTQITRVGARARTHTHTQAHTLKWGKWRNERMCKAGMKENWSRLVVANVRKFFLLFVVFSLSLYLSLSLTHTPLYTYRLT